MSNYLPDDNQNVNMRNYLLDPLSVIVKLAILASKPVGTKVCIQQNILSFQEPGPFQALCRMIYQLNKTDLHYMYNPIQLACSHFMSRAGVKAHPRIRNLFAHAQRGLERLMMTYAANSTICHSLYYYYALISNYVEPSSAPAPASNDKSAAAAAAASQQNRALFRTDGLTVLYGEELVRTLNGQWTEKWLTVVLDMIGFLSDTSISTENIRALESLMMTIDKQTQQVFVLGSGSALASKIDSEMVF
jgi:hypothetical protein